MAPYKHKRPVATAQARTVGRTWCGARNVQCECVYEELQLQTSSYDARFCCTGAQVKTPWFKFSSGSRLAGSNSHKINCTGGYVPFDCPIAACLTPIRAPSTELKKQACLLRHTMLLRESMVGPGECLQAQACWKIGESFVAGSPMSARSRDAIRSMQRPLTSMYLHPYSRRKLLAEWKDVDSVDTNISFFLCVLCIILIFPPLFQKLKLPTLVCISALSALPPCCAERIQQLLRCNSLHVWPQQATTTNTKQFTPFALCFTLLRQMGAVVGGLLCKQLGLLEVGPRLDTFATIGKVCMYQRALSLVS